MQHSVLHTRDKENIHLYETGEGEPVVFLHGWGTTHDLLEPVMTAIAPKYRAIAWDARGHGTHPYRLESPATVEHLVDDLNELLDHHRLDSARLFGHSMGGAIVWAYLRKYGTARVKQTVIVDMTPKLSTDKDWPYGVYFNFPPEKQQSLLSEMQADIAEAVLRLLAYGHNPKTRALYEANDPSVDAYRQILRGFNPVGLISIWQDLICYDFRDFLSRLSVPTLLIYGGASQFYGQPLAEWMLKTLPHAELMFVPDGDHGPHVQYPIEVAGRILKFFGQSVT